MKFLLECHVRIQFPLRRNLRLSLVAVYISVRMVQTTMTLHTQACHSHALE